mgnify:CR=1 FL=1
MKKLTRIKIGALVAAVLVAIQSMACVITTYPDCSAYIGMQIFTCGTGIHMLTPSGGDTVPMASFASPGALDDQELPNRNCRYKITVTFCNGTESEMDSEYEITPTMDTGQGPCPVPQPG